jgi:hypothetical protein
MKSLIHIQPATMEPCVLTAPALGDARQSWLCIGCSAPKPKTAAIDVSVEDLPDCCGAITFVNGAGVTLIRRKFLARLGIDKTHQLFHVGKVSDAHGVTSREWVTIRGKHRVIVRGVSDVAHRVCENCGRHVYFAMGDRYLYPGPPESVAAAESDLNGLVVTRSLADELRASEWPSVIIEELPVLAKPLDALGELL